MSADGQPATARPLPAALTVDLEPSAGFDWHDHDAHQIAFATKGVLGMAVGDAAWVLPPSRALWIPAGIRHSVTATGATRMVSVYIPPARSPLDWDAPTVLNTTGLLGALLEYLGGKLEPDARARAELVLWDQIEAMPATTISLPMPHDPRALQVAERLQRDVTDERSLAEWGAECGASARTLARLFLAETGMTFARWRTTARLAAALRLLAAGESTTQVAYAVGYAQPSAFVAAFRREIGSTPAAYFGKRA
jgi:AraC-like DNA-binding protein